VLPQPRLASLFLRAIVAIALAATAAGAQERSPLQALSRGAASVVTVVTRDASGNRLAATVGVFADIGRLVVPRAILLDRAYSAAIVYGGRERRITAVLGDDPRGGLALVAVDLPDGAPPAITVRTSHSAPGAGGYRALADDGTESRVELGSEVDVAGVGPVCRVTTTGPMPASGTPVVDDAGEMVGVLVDRSAGDTQLAVVIPSARVLAIPPVAPLAIPSWARRAQGARPVEAEAAFARGLHASLAGRADDAADGFREAVAHDEDDADASAALAAAELAAGHREAAFAAYRRAIVADPVNPRYRHDLGVALSDADRWQEAVTEFAEVARLRPTDAEAHFNLGSAYGRLGKYEDEYKAYQEALQHNSAHVNALRNLGIVCIALMRYPEAVAVSARALRFRPFDARLHAQLGVAYYDLKDYPAAIDALKKAVELEPGFVQAHYGLAVAYAASGQREAALKESERLRTLDPARGAEVARLVAGRK
jgi:tetratricopeptide (TPR) repeat protein